MTISQCRKAAQEELEMLTKILAGLGRITEERRIARRLRALDDHQLQDLGAARDQIEVYVDAIARSGDLRDR